MKKAKQFLRDYDLESKYSGIRLGFDRVRNFNLSRKTVNYCKFKSVEFTDIDFSRSSFSHTKFKDCDFTRCDFTDSNLMGASFENCIFSETEINTTKISTRTFSNCEGLYTFSFGQHQAILLGDYIAIGCICLSVENWLTKYIELGRRSNYTNEQISAYGGFIFTVAKMKGIDALSTIDIKLSNIDTDTDT